VGQPVDRIPHQLDRAPGRGDLRLAVKAHGNDLPVDPVAEPQPALMPPRRLGNPQTTQQHLRFRHDTLLASPGRAECGPAPSPPTRTAPRPIDTASPVGASPSELCATSTCNWRLKGWAHP